VSCVRLRQGGAWSERTLREAFQRLSVDTSLEGAAVEVEIVVLTPACNCGFRFETIGADPTYVTDACPRCGAVLVHVDPHRLELIEIVCDGRAEQASPLRPCERGSASPANWRV